MEDNLIFCVLKTRRMTSKKWKTTSTKLMEDKLKKNGRRPQNKMEDNLNFFFKSTSKKWKTTLKKIIAKTEMEDDLNFFLKIKDDLNFLTLEDNLNVLKMEDDQILT
jgi:hypothetical protein